MAHHLGRQLSSVFDIRDAGPCFYKFKEDAGLEGACLIMNCYYRREGREIEDEWEASNQRCLLDALLCALFFCC